MSKVERPKYWKEQRQSIKHRWFTPVIFFEWVCEWISYWLGEWAFLQILEYLGRLSILVAVILYFMEADERRMQSTSLHMQVENLRQQLDNQQKAKHYQAWQVINAVRGQPYSGGRPEALQDLFEDKVSLANVDLSNANLIGINLERADLKNANLENARLGDANLAGAYLMGANLKGANLYKANLSGANLTEANLSNAILFQSSFRNARLWGTILIGAKCGAADFSNARIEKVDFSNADFSSINMPPIKFFGTQLCDSNLINIRNRNGWNFLKIDSSTGIGNNRNEPNDFSKWVEMHGLRKFVGSSIPIGNYSDLKYEDLK